MKFLTDAMLGKLTRFLRMFGYDTLYANDLEDRLHIPSISDEKLLEYAIKEDRILITRDLPFHEIAKDKAKGSIHLQSKDVYKSLKILKHELGLEYNFSMGGARCSVCNGKLTKIDDKEKIIDEVKEGTFNHYDNFYQCENCHKIYWKGSHIQDIVKKLEQKVN
ncbi:MAG: hypothetical protein EU544_04095 [Promethearchaeota archaeon]|nr:MAG: hypothetical protein EU544_04095 [Candidatus Lokiarchaeota archaeon]